MKPKNIKHLLPLYLGQEVETDWLANKRGILVGFNLEFQDIDCLECFIYDKERARHKIPADKFILLLRPLSSITDEEINHLWDEVLGWYEDEINKYRDVRTGFKTSRYKVDLKEASLLLNYLRSVGIDCDGLIEAGLAKEKTKLK